MKMKTRLLLSTVVLLFLLFVFVNDELLYAIQSSIMGQLVDGDTSCYGEPSSERSLPAFDTGKEERRLAAGKNIFFHETSCFGESGSAELNCRQACAVESAALMNPSFSVNLLFLSPSPPSNRTKRMIERLLEYRNVKVSRVHVNEYFKYTPIEDWYARGILSTSRWPRSHMSDIMRFLTLWKFGGFYLDLDVVITKSLEDLTDFAGAEDWKVIAAGAIGFSLSELGRTLADACIEDLMLNFRGNVWGNNGPGVITRTLQKLCAEKYVKDMTSTSCRGFRVFPPSTFYPIFYKDWRLYFSRTNASETMRAIGKARAIHVWNKLSSSENVTVGSGVPYALVAERHCPLVYSNCGAIF